MNLRCLALVVIALLPSIQPAWAKHDKGRQSAIYGSAGQPLTPDALVRLRDIGPPAILPQAAIFAISPDGERIAYQIHQGDPDSNSYDVGLYVAHIAGKSAPIRVDHGGQIILGEYTWYSGIRQPVGVWATITPQWSSDGKSIFFLKRIAGSTQVWRARSDGSGADKVTKSLLDISAFVLLPDNRRLVYSSGPEDPDERARLDQEALRGYRFDGRYMPISSDTPGRYPAKSRRISVVDIGSGAETAASPGEIAILEKAKAVSGRESGIVSRKGHLGWTAEDAAKGFPSEINLYAEDASGRERHCDAENCSSANAISWSADGQRLRYLRREGWANSLTAVYEWVPGATTPVRLYTTADLLEGCQSYENDLICVREGSTTPRQIVRLDPRSRKVKVLIDPNPEFSTYRLGHVERLHWRNEFDIESYGDLVYPANYVPGRSYPLIVVQYITRGFLRGGVGDELPIQAMANRGFAVLSVQRPRAYALAKGARDSVEFERLLLRDFRDRRSVLSSIERAVQMVVQRGIADPAHLGIHGLSDGSSTVQFVAVNSKMFTVGSVSACCWEPGQDALIGPGTEFFHTVGWPNLIDKQPEFWSRISLVENARKISMALLMQASDDEFRLAVPSYMALRQASKPAALYIFPGERHIKWQPAHRLAVYKRNLQWFDFWLKGVEAADPVDAEQYKQWRSMKVSWQSEL